MTQSRDPVPGQPLQNSPIVEQRLGDQRRARGHCGNQPVAQRHSHSDPLELVLDEQAELIGRIGHPDETAQGDHPSPAQFGEHGVVLLRTGQRIREIGRWHGRAVAHPPVQPALRAAPVVHCDQGVRICFTGPPQPQWPTLTSVMTTNANFSPRERMVYSAVQLVREQGVTGTGVRSVIERADAPRGSFQHYFPGGKDQLVSEAISWAGDFAASWVKRYLQTSRKPTPAGLFAHMAGQWKAEYTTRGCARGCPLVAAAADVAAGESAVNAPLRSAFDGWESAVAEALSEMGVPVARARRLAVVMLSTLEGAIALARVEGNVRPLTTVVAELGPLLDAATG